MTTPAAIPTSPRNPALRYYGGKFRLGGWIAKQFPPHVSYVEPFGGGAGVLLRKPVSPVEVFNDLDSAVINYFRVLRQQPHELMAALELTPFSREEFNASFEPCADPLEFARRFFVRSWQGFGGALTDKTTGWKVQKGLWLKSRANQLEEWHQAKRNIEAVASRFRSVQIEHADALEVIRRFDTPETVFYCDPPYPTDTRNVSWCSAYKFEFTQHDHIHLSNLLRHVRGAAVVSSYPNPMYDELYRGWTKLEKTTQTMNKTIATEVLYVKPAPPSVTSC